MYVKEGTEYIRKIGSRESVVAGTSYCTSCGLTKDQLIVRGNRILSKKRSEMGKARFEKGNPFVRGTPEEKKEEESTVAEPAVKRRVRKRLRRRAR